MAGNLPHRFEVGLDDHTYQILLDYRAKTGCNFREAIRRAIRAQYGSAVPRIETRDTQPQLISRGE